MTVMGDGRRRAWFWCVRFALFALEGDGPALHVGRLQPLAHFSGQLGHKLVHIGLERYIMEMDARE